MMQKAKWKKEILYKKKNLQRKNNKKNCMKPTKSNSIRLPTACCYIVKFALPSHLQLASQQTQASDT